MNSAVLKINMQELIEAAKALEPYLDAIICYASTMEEHEPNRLAFNLRSALSNAETHLPALKAAGGWRDIESAPKDGTKFLAAWKSGAIGIVWCHQRGNFTGGTSDRCGSPDLFSADWFSHWMPLPPAPGSLALGAVPEGGEERGSSRTDPSAANGRPETPSSAGFQVHVLKTHPVPFAAVRARVKKLEIRRADRDFKAGDTLWLDEYDPETDTKSGEVEIRVITHVLPGGQYGIEPDYVALSIDDAPLQRAQPTSPSANGASAGNSGLDEPLPPARPYSAASRP